MRIPILFPPGPGIVCRVRLFSAATVALTMAGLSGCYSAQVSRDTIDSRDDAVAVIAELRKIHTPEGIELLEQVELGGVSQWISIRGRNRENPVLLFIHGGPGDPMIGLSWSFQNPWEDYFTVVQWDQRGTGKNAASADREALKGTLTLDRLVGDAEELVMHLRERLGKEKVVVMAYSLGGLLGVHLAKRRPEWYHAYVGIGQVSHNFVGALHERTLEIAVERGEAEAVSQLEALTSQVAAGALPTTDPSLWTIWQWATAFDGGWFGKGGWDLYFDLALLAPEYTYREGQAALEAFGWINNWGGALGDDPGWLNNEYAALDLRDLGPDFKIPVFLFHGRYDLTPPIENAQSYLDWINAPHKRLVTFERSAHIPFVEEPGRFLVALMEHVLPLTEGPASYEAVR